MNNSITIKKGETLELNIEKLAFGGLGISHFNGIVIFVKNGLPGQTVKAKIYKTSICRIFFYNFTIFTTFFFIILNNIYEVH